MTKLKKKISVILISLLFLLNMGSAGNAETTISAEGQYIFNTLAFYIGAVLGHVDGCRFLYVRMWFSYYEKCINNCS